MRERVHGARHLVYQRVGKRGAIWYAIFLLLRQSNSVSPTYSGETWLSYALIAYVVTVHVITARDYSSAREWGSLQCVPCVSAPSPPPYFYSFFLFAPFIQGDGSGLFIGAQRRCVRHERRNNVRVYTRVGSRAIRAFRAYLYVRGYNQRKLSESLAAENRDACDCS